MNEKMVHVYVDSIQDYAPIMLCNLPCVSFEQ